MTHLEAKVVIVGSGVAGSLVASLLLERGVSPVLMLEAGPDVLMGSRRVWLDHAMSGGKSILPYESLYDVSGDYISSGVEPWQLEGGRIFGRGGSTLHWGGWCPRMKPEDFFPHSHVGRDFDWPLSYEDLEQFYGTAENYLQVAGDSTEPGRSRPYPLDAAPFPLSMEPIVKALELSDIKYSSMPVARNTKSIDGMPACQTTGTCDYCPTEARFTGNQPLDKMLVKYPGKFTLLTGSPVKRLIPDDSDRIAGLEFIDRTTGELRRVEAEQFFLCAGALEVPKLLLRSNSSKWPNGIGNSCGVVGRYLVASPFLVVSGRLPMNLKRYQSELNFPNLCSRNWDRPETQRSGKMLMTVNYNSPGLDLAKNVVAGRTRSELQSLADGPCVYQLWGAVHSFSHYENLVRPESGNTRFGLSQTNIETPVATFDEAVVGKYIDELKGLLEKIGADNLTSQVYPQRGDHAMCTTRMSLDPRDGVVAPDLRVHGVSNLFIGSNSVFSSGTVANPTLTLVALILRAQSEWGFA